jgi:hypothetical protein
MAKRSDDVIPSDPGAERGRGDDAATGTGVEDTRGIASDEDDEFDDDDDDLEDLEDEDSEDL